MKNRLSVLTFLLVVLMSFGTGAKAASYNSYIAASLLREAPYSLQQLYDGLHLEEYGLNRSAMNYAVQGYQSLVNQGIVKNNQYLTIVDFSQPSSNKRFYVLDVENRQLVAHTFALHGKNSGVDMAESFSNTMNSNKSSLGFYLTKYTYMGSRGFSLRLAGLEEGFNDNAEKRGVVLHGTRYANEERAENGTIGRSQGCPAIPTEVYRDVIDRVKDGSVMFIYAPVDNYISESPVLNSGANPFHVITDPLVPVI